MGFMDRFRGNRQSQLPNGAKVVRRQRRRGGQSDTGYWYNNEFFLINGTLVDSYDYVGGTGEVLSTSEAREELADAGYNADNYTAPSTSSYDNGSSYSGGGSSYDSGSSYSGGSSYDSGSSYSGGSSSYDSGSSYSSGSSSSSSSYDSGSSSSSSDSGSSW